MAQPSCLVLLLTLASTLAPDLVAQELQQSPRYAVAPEGGSIDITCSSSGAMLGLYLHKSWLETTHVIYYEDGKAPTVDHQFEDRINFSGSQDNLTVTMRLLQLADSGTYICQSVTNRSFQDFDVWGSGTVIVVTENPSQVAYRCQEPQQIAVILPAALAVGFLLLGLGLGALCVLRAQIKKMCASKDKNSSCVVYEDMSFSRCNTMSIPNQYQ